MRIEEKELLKKFKMKYNSIKEMMNDEKNFSINYQKISRKLVKLLSSKRKIEKIIVSQLINIFLMLDGGYKFYNLIEYDFNNNRKYAELKIDKFFSSYVIDIYKDVYAKTNYIEIYTK